jgi:hypothetical protein
MSSTTLQSHRYTPARPQAVGDALRELSAAAGRVLKALRAALQLRAASSPRPVTPSEEANRVRELATSYLQTDPGFATDLFAAADRYERANGL